MIPKFRVWNKKTESFIDYGDLMLDLKNAKVYAGDVGIPEYTIDVTKQVVLMQSTGLKDQNGVEIFEGDILSFIMEEYEPSIDLFALSSGEYEQSIDMFVGNEYRAEVKYYRGGFFAADYHLFEILSDGWEIEVIGNVYENLELLEVAE